MEVEAAVDGKPGQDRAVGYIRVSLERPGMISPDLQLAAIRAYCETNAYELVGELADIDESGRRWDGRKIESAVTMIECGFADVLVVARWSRLSRNRLDWALAMERIDRAGGRVESAIESVDATTSAGRFTRAIFAEQAAFESDRQADYARAKCARRVSDGLPADAFDRFGYRKVGRHYFPDPVTGKVLASMYRRYIAGRSMRQITLWLRKQNAKTPGGLPRVVLSSNSVARTLDRGFGAGLVFAYGEFHPGRHEPVITASVWQKYQAVRSERQAQRNPALRTDPDQFEFNGFLTCAACGGRLVGGSRRVQGQIIQVYACRTEYGPKVTLDRCLTVVRAGAVKRTVLRRLNEFVADPQACAHARQGAEARCADSRVKFRDLDREISRLDHVTSDQLAELAHLEREASYTDPVRRVQDLIDDWPELSPLRRRARLRPVLSSVVMHRQTKPGQASPMAGPGPFKHIAVSLLWETDGAA